MLEKKRIYFDINYSRKDHDISLKKQSRKSGKITNNTIANVNSSQQQEIACLSNLTENGIRYKKFLPRSILYNVTKHNQEKNLRLWNKYISQYQSKKLNNKLQGASAHITDFIGAILTRLKFYVGLKFFDDKSR